MEKSFPKSRKTLEDFQRYCFLHPHERFWQALRNWAGKSYIYTSNVKLSLDLSAQDTFYFEGKDR
jgi:hypothetical protein